MEARRFNFISCLILTAQNGFGRDVDPFVALCRETWGEEILFDALKDLPHGKLKLEEGGRHPADGGRGARGRDQGARVRGSGPLWEKARAPDVRGAGGWRRGAAAVADCAGRAAGAAGRRGAHRVFVGGPPESGRVEGCSRAAASARPNV